MLNYSDSKKETMGKVYEYLQMILETGAPCFTNVYSKDDEIQELLDNKMINYFTFSFDNVHWYHLTISSWSYCIDMSISYKPSRKNGSGQQLKNGMENKTWNMSLNDIMKTCDFYKHIGDRNGNINPFNMRDYDRKNARTLSIKDGKITLKSIELLNKKEV